MAIEVKVPALGESVVEATVGQWRKAEGDAVKVGEILVDLETDKVNLEVAADAAGVLEQITRREGETVQIGDVLAMIGAGDGQAAAPPTPAQAQPAPQAAEPPTTGGGYGGRAPAPNGPAEAPAPAPASAPAPAEDVKATPVARRVAAEHGVDLAAVPPSGPGGRTSKEDVIRYVEQQARPAPAPAPAQPAPTPAPAPAPAPQAAPQSPIPNLQSPVSYADREERVRMTRRRQTIAQRLVEAKQTTAMLTTFNEIDMGAVMELRKKRRESFQQRHGVKLGFMSFFVKATLGALKAFPLLNAEIQGNEIVLKKHYDIGIAVGAEGGLVVPVMRDADRLSFPEIERRIEDFGKRAQAGTLSIEDLQGGTFTITNGGVFGSLLSTPILNPPQVGILGMHKIEERPMAVNGQVVIRPMMYVALSYDHRIVDGREAVQFLVRVKELIEDPETLLLEG